jgi:hypothetical protein
VHSASWPPRPRSVSSDEGPGSPCMAGEPGLFSLCYNAGMSSDPFRGVIGHTPVKRLLQHAITQPHHAYLLIGGDGVGAHLLAERFVRALLAMDDAKPLAAHPDAVLLYPEEGKTTISVEQVRELRGRMARRPVVAPRVVAYLPTADRLNDAGANALLKNLEEPAAGAVFVMVAGSAESLPGTIRSRVVSLPLGPVSTKEMDVFLTEKGFAEADRRAAIHAANGSPGRALRYLQDADERVRVAEDARTADALLRAASAGSMVAALDAPARAADAADDSRGAWQQLLDGLMHALSDRFTEQPQRAAHIGRALASTRRRLSGPVAPRLVLELALIEHHTTL